MTNLEIITLRRILAEIKEAATNFGDTPAELINRLCDANYLAERGVKLIDKATDQGGDELGFEFMTVRPGKSDRHFSAEPKSVTP